MSPVSEVIRLIVAGTFAASLLVPTLASQASAQAIEDGYNATVDGKGNIRVPDVDYQAKWQFLGTWSSLADDGKGAQDLHNVYAQPGVIEAYRKNGKFPDAAVLIKDVLLTKTMEMTTGTISHATMREGWFVMIKDAKGRSKATHCGATAGVGAGSMPMRRPRRPQGRLYPVSSAGEGYRLDTHLCLSISEVSQTPNYSG